MSDDAVAVAVRDPDERWPGLVDGLEDAGASVRVDEAPSTVGEAVDLVVVVGEHGLGAHVAAVLGTDASSTPILPIDAGRGLRSVGISDPIELAETILAGDWETESHRPLSVTVDDEALGPAVYDVTLVTTEAARISEYAVTADGAPLGRSRADGVVVATPAGSTEYARRVDAPVLAPGTGLAVAWIAPFTTTPDRYVVDPTVLELAVERDDAAVELVVDDRVTRQVTPGETVELARSPSLSFVVLENSPPRFG